jgi:antitoxin HigA-1
MVTNNEGERMARIVIHPGEHLAEELDALKMSAAELARQLKVPTNRVTEILNGQRAITGDAALRLAHFFGTSAEFWLNLQSSYELRLAEARTGKAIKKLPTLKHWGGGACLTETAASAWGARGVSASRPVQSGRRLQLLSERSRAISRRRAREMPRRRR